jgi:RHS repeat-associated protein
LKDNGNAAIRYTQGLGIDEPLAVYHRGGSYYFHADALGSIVAFTYPSNGAIAASYGYDSFGNLTSTSSNVKSTFQFTGREFDSEWSLYYYRARYYDPTVGRFLSEDPLQFEAGTNFY